MPINHHYLLIEYQHRYNIQQHLVIAHCMNYYMLVNITMRANF